MLKRTTFFVGVVLTGMLLNAGCSSAPAGTEQTPDPAKAATPLPKNPNAPPPAPMMPDPKTMMKLKKEGKDPFK